MNIFGYGKNEFDSINVTKVNTYTTVAPTTNNELTNKLYVDNSVLAENIFDRSGTTITTHVPGDMIEINDIDIYNQLYMVPGFIDQPLVVDDGSFGINVTTCEAIVDDGTGFRAKFTIPEKTGLVMVGETINFIVINYNAGVPEYQTITDGTTIDYATILPVAQVYYETGLNNKIFMYGLRSSDLIKRIQKWMIQNFFVKHTSGLVFGTTLRTLQISEGKVWFGVNEITIPAFTSATTSFHLHTYNGIAWAETITGNTDWDNQNYNPLTGLTALSNDTKYTFFEIFVTTNGEVDLVYGQAQYSNLAEASAAARVVFLPGEITNGRFGYIYIGRIVFHKNSTTSEARLSAFTQVVPMTAITDHGNLTGLTDDDHLQYVAITGRASETYTTPSTSKLRYGGIGGEGNTTGTIMKVKTPSTTAWNGMTVQYPGNNYDALALLGQTTGTSDIGMGASRDTTNGWWSFQNIVGCVIQEVAGNTYAMFSRNNSTATLGAQVTALSTLMAHSYDTGVYHSFFPQAYNDAVGGTNHALSIDNTGKIGLSTSLRAHKTDVTPLDYEKIVYGSIVRTIRRNKLINNTPITDENGNYIIDEDSDPEPCLIAEEVFVNAPELCVYEDTANKEFYRTKPDIFITKKDSIWKPVGVNYVGFVSPLIKVVQIQKATIENLKTRCTNLETAYNSLILQFNALVMKVDNHIAETL